jgi:hypothetical protein
MMDLKNKWKFMYKATVSQSCSTIVKQIVRISLMFILLFYCVFILSLFLALFYFALIL